MGHRSFYMSVLRVLLVVVLTAGCSAVSEILPPTSTMAFAPTASPSPSPLPITTGFTPDIGMGRGSPVVLTTPGPQATPRATANTGALLASIDLHRFVLTGGVYDGTKHGPPSPATGPVFLVAPTTGTWTSEWREPGFSFTRLVPSWNASTPVGTWMTVEAQARGSSGGETPWYSFGTWAFPDDTVKRATVDGQRDAVARVETDTLIASAPLDAYRLRVTLARNSGLDQVPMLQFLTAVASDDAAVRGAPRSAHDGAVHDLPVPQYSQEIHAGEYPEYDGGGEAWCSPTSTTMVLGHWGRGPTPADVSWVDPRYKDPGVDHAARFTYDATYGGTGNWAFNTAYAAQYGVNAFVTQLRSLAEAERFIARGIPLVASINVPPGGLPGFLYAQGTNGHLLVIRGFTANGDVIANDPAALSNADVRRVYPRAAFERVWVGGSGGIVYVIHPADHALPERVQGATANW